MWVSSIFSAFLFLLFGCLYTSAFVGAAESSNALAALMHTAAAAAEGFSSFFALFICLFHVAALLPNIVLAQISSR